MIEQKRIHTLKNISGVDLFIAISALCLSWVPILGVLVSVISIIILTPLVVQSVRNSELPKSSVKFVISIIATGLAVFISLAVTASVFSSDTTVTQRSNADSSYNTQISEEERKANQEAQQKAQEEAERSAAEAKAAKQVEIDSATFIANRELALILKDPDANIGKIFKIWGEISQFDSATGTNTFRAQISHQREQYWYTDGYSVILTGNASDLRDYIEDDVFLATIEVEGSTTYSNIMGGGNTVPTFTIHRIEQR